ESDLGHLPESLDEGRVGSLDLVQEWIRERVVELERDAKEERPRNEDEKVAVLEEGKRVQPKRITHAEARASGLRGRVRQRERVCGHHDRRAGGKPHRKNERVSVKYLAYQNPRHDPPN